QPGRERPPSAEGPTAPRSSRGVAHAPPARLHCHDFGGVIEAVNDANNRLRIPSQMHTTIRRAINHDLRPIARPDDPAHSVVDPPSHLSSSPLQTPRPSRLTFDAVLGGANALRSASTVRSARPSGVDPACAPLDPAFARWSRFESRLTAFATRR